MPVSQVYRFQKIVRAIVMEREKTLQQNKMWYKYHIIKDAGHFAVSDQPEEAAEYIIDFMESLFGLEAMQKAFFGVNHIARRDEPHLMEAFDNLLNQR